MFFFVFDRAFAKRLRAGRYKKNQKKQEPNMLPPTCWATPAFGSGQRAGTELSLQDEFPLPGELELSREFNLTE